MPYISEEDRKSIKYKLERWVEMQREISMVPHWVQVGECTIENIAEILREVPSKKVKGAFNYFVSRLWLNTFFPNGDSIGYTSLSDSLAVFNDMEHEMRTRLMDKYEHRAMKINGDLPEMIVLNQKHQFVRL